MALTALMLFAFSAAIAMPFNITGIVAAFDVSNTAAGLVASFEMSGVAVGSLLFSQLAPRMHAKHIYLSALSVIAAANAVSLWAPGIDALYATRAVAGIAAGAMAATVMATAGRSTRPEGTFAILNSGVGVMAMLLALLLPQALGMHARPSAPAEFTAADGLYSVYLLLAIVAFVFVAPSPAPAPLERADDEAPGVALPVSGWLALTGLGVLFLGHGALVMFIVNVGTEQVRLSPERVGVVFLFGSLFGIIAPLITGRLAMRLPALLLAGVLGGALVPLALVLGTSSAATAFYLCAPPFAMMPMALMPVILGALARIDPSGRLTGAHPAFLTLGTAAAPLLGGALSTTGDYSANGWFVAGCVLLSAAALTRALMDADALRAQAASRPSPLATEATV